MEYTALFIWLTLCLMLGGLINYLMAGALTHRLVRLLAAPGLFIRKFTMTVVALCCGATVTRVCVYDAGTEDIGFQADGIASIAKVLAPLAPLFGCAVALGALNASFGRPLSLDYSPPALSSLDSGGMRGFVLGTWSMLSSGVQQGLRADWHDGRLYVLFALIFSLGLGASAPMERVKEAILGAALVAVALALFSSISVRRAGVVAATPGWFAGIRDFVISASGVAFILMVYAMITALFVGLAVRIYEVASRSGSGSRKGRTAKLPPDREGKRAA